MHHTWTITGVMALNLLQINPEKEISFPKLATVTTAVSRKLIVTNCSNNEHVAFKVKTTAPKSYLVRPSSGVLSGSGASQEIQIILQPQGEGSDNHRFMVQGAVVASPDAADKDMWRNLAKDQIHEQRLNVAFADGPTPAASVGGATAKEEPAPAYGGGQLQTRYDDLVKQTLLKEKEINKLKQDVENAKKVQKSSGGGEGGYSLKDVVLVALIAFIVAFLLRYM